MPTHNRCEVIEFAIKSVLAQTFDDFELLVVGDGCTDNTSDVVGGFDDPRIVWFDLPKAPYFGYANRNIALRQARGELIAFAAHDDLLFPDHLQILAQAIEEPRFDMVYSRPLWVSTDGTVVPYCTNLENADELRFFLNVGNPIPASCILHRRSCFDRSGYWPEDIERGGDWHFWKRIIQDGGGNNFGYVRAPTTLHFSAKWKKSRFSQSEEVRAMLDMADRSSWWPQELKYSVADEFLEQSVIHSAMVKGGPAWSRDVRKACNDVVDRIAWDYVQGAYDQLTRIRSELAMIEVPNGESVIDPEKIENPAGSVHNLARRCENQHAEITKLKQTIHEFQQSTSWRVTRPLRDMTGVLKRIFGK